jgi:hypothetical protein
MSDLNGTVERIVPVTPSDASGIPTSDGVHVNASGDLRFLDRKKQERTLYLLAGVPYPYRVSKVFATGTTATGVHALYFDSQ